jgi:hypothetical protein
VVQSVLLDLAPGTVRRGLQVLHTLQQCVTPTAMQLQPLPQARSKSTACASCTGVGLTVAGGGVVNGRNHSTSSGNRIQSVRTMKRQDVKLSLCLIKYHGIKT